MQVLKAILLVVAIVSVPALSFFLIRLTLKLGRGLEHLNRTLDDARPQVNMLLVNLNHTLDEVNGELEKFATMTSEAQVMLSHAESGMRSVEETLRSPVARLGGMLAGFLGTSLLFRGAARRLRERGNGTGR